MTSDLTRMPLVPKEHGASFMAVHALLLGIVAGLTAGGRDLAGAFLALAFGALALPLSAAVSVMTRAALASRARRRVGELVGAMGIAGVLTLLHGPARQLFVLSAVGAALTAAYAAGRAVTGPRSVPTQLFAIACISLLAPLAWLLVAGPTARWPLSAPAAFLAFGGTVPYVRERVRRRRFQALSLGDRLRGGSSALAWQTITLLLAALAAGAGIVHWLVLLAFVPAAAKTFLALLRPESRPPIRRIGYLETAVSTSFAVLVAIGLGITPPA